MKGLEMKLSTLSLDHLGLVAAIFDALGISDVIDESIPKTRNCKAEPFCDNKSNGDQRIGFRGTQTVYISQLL